MSGLRMRIETMKTVSPIAVLSSAVVVGVAIAVVCARCPCDRVDEGLFSPDSKPHVGEMGRMPSGSTGKRVIVMGDDLTVGAYSGADGITLEFREVPPGQGPASPVNADYFFATSFPVVDVAGRQSSEVFVLGAENVIERWTHEVVVGSRYLSLKESPVAPGVPVPGVEQGIKGGTWLPLAQRPKELRQRRNIVLNRFSGPEFGALHVDPEGRYLLLMTKESHDVFQLGLFEGAIPVQIAAVNQLPLLSESTGGHLAHHQSMGRLFIVERATSSGTVERGILIDADNNGIFESVETRSQAEWNAQGMDGQVWFRPDFFDYSAN